MLQQEQLIDGKPAYFITGIKVDLYGRKRYKCRYTCECGNKGNHYIPLGTDYVTCHVCEYHNYVEPAGRVGKDGVPARDKRGNYFIAYAFRY
ncbi:MULTISPECIES: hypothetical protein [unclassified Sporosarcina]|uniref:hypothetical protein n=1 Tax=unclassified Sporosarcina TaxID=2647733 RepID=UPI00203DA917|nr:MULTISPECIES: hypothetical protein [unclassified Sporosarcina]GKV66729.1 hypothetical protein NCCP2331_28820 [Sporosarcina sp. NCCP-2331]GLB57088.1 hypothetical protein NCCP2378_28750 [Sporosarcina sp. NCCP-2378]